MIIKICKSIACCLLSCILLAGCSPSYPKKDLPAALAKMIKKDYKIDSRVVLRGKTLYLDLFLTGIASTDPKMLNNILKKIQGAMLSITRVSLSSDAKIEYMVVNARDASWSLNIRLIQRLEDVKGLLYQKISKSDYEGRLVLEIETLNRAGAGGLSSVVGDMQYDMTLEEFMGRLMVSQINMASRTNPFLSVLLNNVQLRYEKWMPDQVFVNASSAITDSAYLLFENIIRSETQKVVEKYKIWRPRTMVISLADGRVMTINIQPSNKLVFKVTNN